MKNKNNIYIKSLLLVVAVVVGWTNVWAEGSKDLYPNGAYGGRATLRASENEATFFPFPSYGTHFVYAQVGETIAIASSAQNSTEKRLYLYNPAGTDVTPSGASTSPNATRGNIPNRAGELAGPRLPGITTGNGYTPVYYTVPTGGEGIYKVEFRGTGTTDADNLPNTLKASDVWTQGTNTIFIYAWDISVSNNSKSAWMTGRVYMNLFAGIISNVNGSNWRGDEYNFYGKFKVHTRDGFMYEVDNNGNAGYRFTFMVNNKGFHAIGDPKTPSYQSIAAQNTTQVKSRYHDPRSADGNDTYTQKIFYSLPDPTMPASANGAVPGGSTWLHVPQPQLNVSTAIFKGVDGASDWAAGNKGGHFIFEAKEGLKYEIKISPSGGESFVERILTGYVQAANIGVDGKARVYWDGKGGNEQPLPNGVSLGGVTLQLQGAEVHFPFIDMEVNPNGLKLQFYNPARNGFLSDKVYWNDTAIGNGGGNTGGVPNPINASHTAIPAGQSSLTNGHKWGSSTGPSNGSTFGNNQGMDTWTFAKGSTYTSNFDVTIKAADLAVTSLSADKSTNLYVGDEITYTAKVKNNGNPDYDFTVNNASFHFVVPEGFEPIVGAFYTFDGNSCGVETGGNNLSFDDATNTFKSKLNLPKNCEVTYTIKVKVTESALIGTGEVKAGILRPADVYDPDGTNTSNPEKPLGNLNDPIDMVNKFYPPFDPFIEAQYNGKGGVSNNIKDIPVTLERRSDLAIVKTANETEAKVGETVTFTLTVTNNGPHDAIGVVVTDTVPAGYTGINTITNGGIASGNVITWNIGNLANMESKVLSFKAKVENSGVYLNTAWVTGDVVDLYLENNKSSINPVKTNTTHAVDDFYETGKNTPVSGNVLDNDYDLESNTQTVTPITNLPTEKGGKVTINSDGTFTYTPPAGGVSDFDKFEYQVCDNGVPQACDVAEVTIAVGICYQEIEGKSNFGWRHENGEKEDDSTLNHTYQAPAANYGFVVDLYNIDNSFNMEINGTTLAVNEIQFERGITNSPQNIRFSDGDEYSSKDNTFTGDVDHIWRIKGTSDYPIIRIRISPTGKITMYGSKFSSDNSSYGLQPLELYGGNKFNVITMKEGNAEINEIKVTQLVKGATELRGDVYGAKRVDCPNYWYGNEGTGWDNISNWTDNYVPTEIIEDVEFATKDNNSNTIKGMSGPGAGMGTAKNDLYVPLNETKEIKDLINKTEDAVDGSSQKKSLVIPPNSGLNIYGVATDSNNDPEKIVVKASKDEATGTLYFPIDVNNPNKNNNVQATVEFYNQAYDCKDCGYFTRSWQYFGIPVKSADFLYLTPKVETINEWMENVNGNKWVNRAVSDKLQAFRGYEITNSSKIKPTHIYKFTGTLNVGDAKVGLTKTSAVNYSGMNLIANSFAAAIPISADAISYSDNTWNGNVYLFNTGTRDQWRKLNGGTVNHDTQSGQYKVIPLRVAGQAGLNDKIPSMHTFMVNAPSSGTMTLAYDNLVKNELVDGLAWRSANAVKQEIPHIVLDVIGSNSADRVWLFEQSGTTRGFDNGWDGVKIPETDIVQLYVAGEDAKENYQVATVPQLVGTSFGLKPENNDGYTLSVAVSQDVVARGLYLRDMLTGRSYALKNGAEYRVSGATSSDNRFKVVDTTLDETKLGDNPLIDIYVVDSQVVVANNSDEDCTVALYDVAGKLVAKKASARNSTVYMSNTGRVAGGVYVVKVTGTQQVNEAKRVVVK